MFLNHWRTKLQCVHYFNVGYSRPPLDTYLQNWTLKNRKLTYDSPNFFATNLCDKVGHRRTAKMDRAISMDVAERKTYEKSTPGDVTIQKYWAWLLHSKNCASDGRFGQKLLKDRKKNCVRLPFQPKHWMLPKTRIKGFWLFDCSARREIWHSFFRPFSAFFWYRRGAQFLVWNRHCGLTIPELD